MKKVVDVCCGGRMFWFNKKNPDVLFLDNRKLSKGEIKLRLSFSVKPDKMMDFRNLKFPDKTFKLVVFDPPHLRKVGEQSWMCKKYGKLSKNWEYDLARGFKECWRVLKNDGVLIFKWSEKDVKLSKVLSLFDKKPLFGHTTFNHKTHWICYMKIK